MSGKLQDPYECTSFPNCTAVPLWQQSVSSRTSFGNFGPEYSFASRVRHFLSPSLGCSYRLQVVLDGSWLQAMVRQEPERTGILARTSLFTVSSQHDTVFPQRLEVGYAVTDGSSVPHGFWRLDLICKLSWICQKGNTSCSIMQWTLTNRGPFCTTNITKAPLERIRSGQNWSSWSLYHISIPQLHHSKHQISGMPLNS